MVRGAGGDDVVRVRLGRAAVWAVALLATAGAGCLGDVTPADAGVHPEADDRHTVTPPSEQGSHAGLLLAPFLADEFTFSPVHAGHAALVLRLTASQPTAGQAAVLVYLIATVDGPDGEHVRFSVGPTSAIGSGSLHSSVEIPQPASGAWQARVEIWPRGTPVQYAFDWQAGPAA